MQLLHELRDVRAACCFRNILKIMRPLGALTTMYFTVTHDAGEMLKELERFILAQNVLKEGLETEISAPS